MTVRLFLISTVLSAVVSWIIWIVIIQLLPPEQAGVLGFALFFLSFFLAIASTSGLINYVVRQLITQELAAYSIRKALRQGILLGLLIISILIINLFRLYQWWLIAIIMVLLVSSEFIFLSYDRSRVRRTRKTKESIAK